MRTEYVIPLQGKIAARIDQLAGDIQQGDLDLPPQEAEKERDNLLKQQAELQRSTRSSATTPTADQARPRRRREGQLRQVRRPAGRSQGCDGRTKTRNRRWPCPLTDNQFARMTLPHGALDNVALRSFDPAVYPGAIGSKSSHQSYMTKPAMMRGGRCQKIHHNQAEYVEFSPSVNPDVLRAAEAMISGTRSSKAILRGSRQASAH